MVPVIVFKASRETVQQHPVTKRNHHHPEERSPMDQKDSETMKLSPFRRKRGRSTHTNCKKANLGPKMTRNITELRDCPQAAIKWSLKDDTGYQYRYTSVTWPLKGTVFPLLTKGDVGASSCHDLINMHEHP